MGKSAANGVCNVFTTSEPLKSVLARSVIKGRNNRLLGKSQGARQAMVLESWEDEEQKAKPRRLQLLLHGKPEKSLNRGKKCLNVK